MSIFIADKVMRRLDKILDNAIAGNPIETDFDETRMSALETKLARYLAVTSAGKSELAEEKQRINELISDISHQTKTPISNLLIYSQLLQESQLSDNDRVCVNALAAQAQKLHFLITSMMKASRLETGIIALSPKPQPIQPMLDSIAEQVAAAAQGKGIDVIVHSTDAAAVFDLKWTTEAVGNILDNAVKYTHSGSVTVSVTSYQMFCRIDIADTGIGISEDETVKIFARFYRSTDVSEAEGIGLGLYLAREIVAGEGGYIKVSSKVGKGSTFSVFLPS